MPYPRAAERYINPRFRTFYQRSHRASWELAATAGFPHQSTFSTLIRSEVVPATALNVERLQRVADALGFPRDQIFLTDTVEEAVAR